MSIPITIVKPLLVGRNDELERCLMVLAQALEGHGSVIIISGETGIGKTLFTEKVKEIARGTGYYILKGSCINGQTLGYFPFIEAFQSAEALPMESRGTDQIRPNRKEGPPNDNPPADAECIPKAIKDNLKEDWYKDGRAIFNVIELLEIISKNTPILIHLEDLHWVDSSSLQLLHFLARNIKEEKIIIVCTFRSDDIISHDSKVHPLLQTLGMMRIEGHCYEIKLDRLNQEEIRNMLEYNFGGQIEDRLLKRIWNESQGNPLFAYEISRLLAETRSVRPVQGKFRLISENPIIISQSVQDVIIDRINRLGNRHRTVLERASIIGESFDINVLASAFGYGRLNLLETLEEIENSTGLVVEKQNQLHFSHELVRRLAYKQIPDLKKIELHRRIGASLEKTGCIEEISGELSNHFFIAGEDGKCLKYSIISGENCIARCGFVEAVPFLERALVICEKNQSHSDFLRILEMLGDAEKELGLYVKASEAFEKCITQSENESSKARLFKKLAECWVPGRLSSDISTALDFLDRAEKNNSITTNDLAEVFSVRAALLNFKGDFLESNRFRLKSEEIFLREGLKERLAIEYSDHAYNYLSLGQIENALSILKEARDLSIADPHPDLEVKMNFWFGQTYAQMGKTSDSREALLKAIDIAQKLGDHYTVRWASFYLALLNDIAGNDVEALEWADRCKEEALQEESSKVFIVPYTIMAHLLAKRGDADGAGSLCQQGIEMLGPYDPSLRTPFHGLAVSVNGEIESLRGNWTMSNALFEKGIQMMEGVPVSLWFEAIARMWYADSLIEQGSNENARKQCDSANSIFERLQNRNMADKVRTVLNKIEIGK